MRYLIALLLQVLVFMPLASYAAPPAHNEAATAKAPKKARALRAYGNIPLYFIKNTGQVDGRVSYYEKGAGHAAFFTEDGLVLSLTKNRKKPLRAALHERPKDMDAQRGRVPATETVRLSFIGARKDASIKPGREMPGRVNYFIGSDRSKWRRNIPTYGDLTYENVYEDIDIRFYGTNRNMEHDIIVHPGADPSVVRFRYDGIKGLKVTEGGDLEVRLEEGEIIEKKPLVYQVIDGKRKEVDGSYRIIKGDDNAFSYGYTVASYDHTRDLVIDPVLVYSTYLGGSDGDSIHSIAVDASGAVYVTGHTLSKDFPLSGPVQGANGGGFSDVFVTKINSTGTGIVYSTYLGGGGDDFGEGIAVDFSEAAYITGITSSADFPLANAVQGLYGGDGRGTVYGGVGTFGSMRGDTFIARLDPSGSALTYSTYLGGSGDDIGNDIAVDSAGAAYITGETTSTDFPLVNPIQTATGYVDWQTFVTKINPAGPVISYSTYLGGTLRDAGYGIAVDSAGAVYIAGITSSHDFPLAYPIQSVRAGAISPFDFFITKIDPAGTALVYSTYLGGSGNEGQPGLAIDPAGAAYVTGYSDSTDYPVASALQGVNAGGIDIVVSKINPSGTALVYSTYLGGSGDDYSSAIAVDPTGSAYVAGLSYSTDYPLANPIQTANAGFSDVVLSRINPVGSALVFSTYLGGLDMEDAWDLVVDGSGAVFLGGWTTSTNFPLIHPLQVIMGDTGDAFITRVSPGTSPPVTISLTPDLYLVPHGSTLGYNVTATNTTAMKQCFQYWEDVTMPGGSTFPASGELLGPVRLCLKAGASKTTHMTHGVPISAPLGIYAMNAYVGAYAFPVSPVVVSESHFTFTVTAFGPMVSNPATSWHAPGRGFRQGFLK